MTTRTTARILVLSIAAPVLVGGMVILVAQRSASSSVPVCIKSNGQVRVLTTEDAACDMSEVRTDWVIGGEVTDVRVGQGLVGSRDGGTVQLAVDPSLVQSCTGCRGGRIFSGFNDGPVALPGFFPEEIARLDLPAGSFAIFAKLTITNTLGEGFDDRVLCTLRADTDFDQGELVLPEDVDTLIQHPYNAAAGLTMQVVHRFTAPGSVTLSRLLQFIDAPAGAAAADIRLLASSASAEEKALLAEWAAFYREPELSLQLLTDAAPHVSHPALVWQPLFRDVRGLPAFRDLARTLGLVEYWRTFGWSDFCQPSTGDEFVCR